MQKRNEQVYKEEIIQRVQKLMDATGLEVPGFADYLTISDSHLYAILNGTRDLTVDVAEKIGAAFDLKGSQILRINYRISITLKKSESLNNFCDENKDVHSYFISNRIERKDSYYIETVVLNSGLFNSPIYIWELREYFKSKEKKYTSKRLSQILNYMVVKGILKSKKRPLKLRNGEYGNRSVDVFFK